MVGFGSFGEHTFIRLVTINPANSKEDIISFFKVIEDFVHNNTALLKSKDSQK